jgi:hypothetical protein
MKKFYFLALLLCVSMILTGCGKNKQEMMDQLNKEGYFHYTNKDLGFGLYLPRQFIYYQTQSKKTDNFTDIEFYVPTSDPTSFDPNVSGYTKPLTIRIFNKKYWNDGLSGDEKKEYEKIGEKKDRVYAALFWAKPSADWTPKWNEEVKKDILSKIEIDK